jgi:hypothetical protein
MGLARLTLLRSSVAFVLFAACASALAQDSDISRADSGSSARFDKVFSLRGGYWSSSRQLDDERGLIAGSVWSRMTYQPNSSLRFAADAWVGNRAMAGAGPKGQVRELYAEWLSSNADFRIGRQIIAWGRADALNPTDNLSARRYSTLVSDDNDQRIGTWAAKAAVHGRELSLIGIFEPRFTPSEIPLRRLPNVRYVDDDNDRHAWALKLQREQGNVDWSISYYDGPDRSTDLAPVSISPAGIELRKGHNRIRVAGADWATALGELGLRGEIAYTQTANDAGTDPFIKKPYFYGVLGVERQFADSTSLIFQGFYKRVHHFSDPAGFPDPLLRPIVQRSAQVMDQLDEHKYGWSMRLAKRWANDTVEGEVTMLMSYPRHDHVLRGKLSYRLTDGWRLIAGMDLLRGSGNSYYGQLRDNSVVYTMLEYGF